MTFSPPLYFMLILIQYPRCEHHIPVPCHTMRPHLDGYDTIMKGTIPSDILVGYCKGPNQSVPSNYVRKGKLHFLRTSSNLIPVTRSYKAWWQAFGLCAGNSLVVSSLTVELVWAVISLPARIGFDLRVSSFLFVITTASTGRCIYKAEYIHNSNFTEPVENTLTRWCFIINSN